MARYTGPKCKLARREGTDLFLKSARRSLDSKCKLDSKPGQHGVKSGMRQSDYGNQLREKQKARRIYGLLERQFRNLYQQASREPGITGETLLRMLEQRIDNVVFRTNFAASRNQARQFVRHGHVLVNGKRVTIPSYRVRPGDVITIGPKVKDNIIIRHNIDTIDRAVPAWLDVSADRFEATVRDVPLREQIDVPVREQLIVELYSK